MPLHPSLKVDSAIAQQRSVLSRIERIKDLMRKGLWLEGQSVTGLPKTKILKIKARKAVKEAVAAVGTEGAPGTTAGAAVAGAKPAASGAAPAPAAGTAAKAAPKK